MPTGLLRGSAVPGPGHVPWTGTAWAGPGRGNAPAPEHVAETMALLPTETAPELALALVGGGTTDDLKLGTEADGRFSLVVFYRGLHCPICRKQLGEIDKRIEDLTATGIGRAVAIPMETEEPSGRIVHQWHLANLPVAYGLSEEAARAWGPGGLNLSRTIKDGEPDLFNEPGIFILDEDRTLFWSSTATMPFGRPWTMSLPGSATLKSTTTRPAAPPETSGYTQSGSPGSRQRTGLHNGPN